MINNLTAFVFIVSILTLVGIVVLQAIMSLKTQRQAQERERDYIAAIMAKNLPEYAATRKELSTTAKDRMAQMKIENDLAIANEKLLREDRGEGIPVS